MLKGRKSSTKVPWESKFDSELEEKENGGWPDDVVAPSAVSYNEKKKCPIPKELTIDQISFYVQKFGEAAKRAAKIHGAHGYLISEFLSPKSNFRNDKYGGSFENRIRFLLEIIKEVKKNWPEEKALGLRLSCSDYCENGWSIDDTVELAKIISTEKDYLVDFIGIFILITKDCSGGGVSKDQKFPKLDPGYQVPFAKKIKENIKNTTKVFAVGLITEPDHCNEIIESESADLVLLARQFLREPSFVKKCSEHFYINDLNYINQYARSKRNLQQKSKL